MKSSENHFCRCQGHLVQPKSGEWGGEEVPLYFYTYLPSAMQTWTASWGRGIILSTFENSHHLKGNTLFL